MQPVSATFFHRLFTDNLHGKSSAKMFLRKPPFIGMVTGLLRWQTGAKHEF